MSCLGCCSDLLLFVCSILLVRSMQRGSLQDVIRRTNKAFSYALLTSLSNRGLFGPFILLPLFVALVVNWQCVPHREDVPRDRAGHGVFAFAGPGACAPQEQQLPGQSIPAHDLMKACTLAHPAGAYVLVVVAFDSWMPTWCSRSATSACGDSRPTQRSDWLACPFVAFRAQVLCVDPRVQQVMLVERTATAWSAPEVLRGDSTHHHIPRSAP